LRLCAQAHNRKNWLFANTPRGAKASAVIYSIVETATQNELDPFAYLCCLFERMPNIDIKYPAAIDELLPFSPSLPNVCRTGR
jgi:transposase